MYPQIPNLYQVQVRTCTLSETHLTRFRTTLIHGFLPRKQLRLLLGNRSQGFRARPFRDPSKARLSNRFLQRQRIHRRPDKQHRQKGARRAHVQPHKRLLPKFQFLLSKGASNSDIVHLVDRCPRLIGSSLENNVIPTFELVRRFLQYDKKTIDCVLASRHFLDYNVAAQNVNMLLGVGVKDSNIAYLFRTRPSILLSSDLMRTVYEVKEMGFDPSKISFVMAMHAKRGISKSRWDAKVDAFKSWGWSEDMVLDTFRKHPLFMLMSRDKINEVMRFWVNRLGWDPLAIARSPKMFAYSLEKRIIPRGLVVRYLIAKGLREKSASLFTPFSVSEKLFLENYVMRFKEEMCQLLKLYQEKMSFQENREDGVAAGG
ncbi:Mitochodrial transcription termination factor-related [Spatholobus suberectus]|nr:Mitochodrial transcription termination factor-related [Spatholobus suberectus]